MHDTSQALAQFSWREEIAQLFQRTRPPRGWIALSAVLMLLTFAVIALCVYLGIRIHGDSTKLFGEKRLGTYYSVALLGGAAGLCLLVWRRQRNHPLERFWRLFGILLFICAADELMHLHEQIDTGLHKLLGRDPDHPITDHLDDLLVACYLIPAAMLWFRNRRHLVRLRLMVQTLGAAALFFAIMVALDAYGAHQAVEESIKVVAGTLIVCAFLSVYLQSPTLPASSMEEPSDAPG